MKKLFFIFLIPLFPNYFFGQFFIENPNLTWENYEKNYEDQYKLEKIKSINDELLLYLSKSGTFEKNLHNFHFIDYNLNGNTDIIYSGDAGTESERTIIFELDNDGNYVKTFDKFGEIVNLISIDYKTPLSLVLKEKPCCGGYVTTYEIYHPIINYDNKIELVPSSKYSIIEGTEIPLKYFQKPYSFEVINDFYYLRLAPTIDNTTENHILKIDGNVIGKYTSGSFGHAIAEFKDDSDRIWWFVLMSNNVPPLMNLFDHGSNNENNYYSVGWMSSRYLIAN